MKLLMASLIAAHSFTAIAKSDLPHQVDVVVGVKYPNSPDEGSEGVYTTARTKLELKGYKELVSFLLGSPDQEGAGSCLYMSLTGTVEWWLAKQNPQVSRRIDGPLDLSERYFMNIAGVDEDHSDVANWKTDSIYHFNKIGHSVLNRYYRFTKGWFKEVDNIEVPYIKAQEGDPEAQYGTEYNWIDDRGSIEKGHVSLPKFRRDVIFADPESNQWNVAVAPSNIVSQVKQALLVNKAPINVIYNHYGYWHAVMIVGFDDNESSENCSFTQETAPYLLKQSKTFYERAEQSQEQSEKQAWLKKALRYKTLGEKLTNAYAQGGCKGKGVFYVRDSLYVDPDGPMYDYDLSRNGDEAHLGKKVILREYEWLTYLANHIIQISAIKD